MYKTSVKIMFRETEDYTTYIYIGTIPRDSIESIFVFTINELTKGI